MKRLLTILLVCPLGLFAQVSDMFSDGDFTSNPVWSGDDSHFEVATDSLHLNAPAATAESYLSTPSQAINSATWSFRFMFDENPSSSNRAKVYLVSDQANLEGSLNGYYVMIGNSTDEVSLYRQTGTSSTEIIDGLDGTLDYTGFTVDVIVTRDDAGLWTLSYDIDPTSAAPLGTITETLVTDATHFQSQYFGVLCDYTSSRSQSFWYDNISVTGNPYVDTIPPTVSSIALSGDSSLTITFSEELETSSATTLTNYTADNGLGNPTSAVLNSNEVTIQFGEAISGGIIYSLQITGVEDLSSNSVSDTQLFGKTEPPVSGDIVLNEIMFNPWDTGADYLEIYNNSSKLFDLSILKIANYNDDYTVNDIEWASADFKYFLPGQYIVITEDSLNIVSTYTVDDANNLVEVVDLPSMNNDDGIIAVLDSAENILDQFAYNEDMHFGLYDDVEGISLERIDPNLTTQDENNWHSAAADIGYGTPGAENSQLDQSTVKDAFTLDPEYFSPDGDGHNDVLNINYTLDNPGVTVNILVFDVRGRLIAQVASSTVLGTEGVLRWDGITNENFKARKGVYALFIEAFELDGTVKNYKLGFTVNGQL